MEKSAVSDVILDLPIMQHFNQNSITTKIDSFRKGEKGIFWFLKLAVILGVGYLGATYILPPVFQAIGQMAALVATGVSIVFLVLMAPVIFKGLRVLTRSIHKMLIKFDPFAELENQKLRMLSNQTVFRQSKGRIDGLKNDMMVEAKKSEEESTKLRARILTLQSKAKALKDELDEMVRTGGAEARNSDEYVNGNADLAKMLSESQRVTNQLKQSTDFIQKYGTRASIMKKLSQKLIMVEADMDIKIADFETTITMLKKDYEFSQKSRAATDAAKNAMLFDKSWELEYALDVVASTIASDIAITSGNLKDIDTYTTQFTLDSDDLYTNLNVIADNIKIGTDKQITAKQYNNDAYRLSSDDKIKSGGFGDLF